MEVLVNCREAGWYVVFFKDGKPIADKVTEDTIDFLIESNPKFENWFYSDKPFFLYGDSMENLELVLREHRSFRGVF